MVDRSNSLSIPDGDHLGSSVRSLLPASPSQAHPVHRYDYFMIASSLLRNTPSSSDSFVQCRNDSKWLRGMVAFLILANLATCVTDICELVGV